MNQGDKILVWVLVISTFLIGGKAIGILNISWLIAFGPIAGLMIVSFVFLVVAGIISYFVIDKKIKDGNDEQ